MSNTGRLIVLSSPSGGGKTTVYKRLLNEMNSLVYSVSYTTRPPRKGEVDGRDYHFLDKKEFRARIRKGEFLEWEKVYGNYYGTSLSFVRQQMQKGKNCIMDLDVKGGKHVKKMIPESILVFLLPPSFGILEERLKNRGTDHPNILKKRLKKVRQELKYRKFYDYILVNDDLEQVIKKMKALITGEKSNDTPERNP